METQVSEHNKAPETDWSGGLMIRASGGLGDGSFEFADTLSARSQEEKGA